MRGLVGVWIPGVTTEDLATGTRATPFNNGGRPVSTPGGNPTRRFTKASSDGLTLGTRFLPTGATGVSVAVLYTPVAGATNGQLLSRDDAGLGRSFISGHNEGGNDYLYLFMSGGDVNLSAASDASGSERLLVGGYNGVLGGAFLLRNGVQLVGPGTAAGKSINSSTGPTTLGYRTYSGSNNPLDGDITLAFLWGRSIYHSGGDGPSEANDHKELVRDPWQVFTWRSSPSVYVFGSGVGGGPPAQDIGASTGTITLTGVAGAISPSGGPTIGAATGTITLTGVAGAITSGAPTIGAATGTITLTGVAGAISASGSAPVGAATGTITLSGVPGAISGLVPAPVDVSVVVDQVLSVEVTVDRG